MITKGMVLVVMGVIHMINGTETNTTSNLMKLGMIISVFRYGQSWLYVGFAFLPSQVEPFCTSSRRRIYRGAPNSHLLINLTVKQLLFSALAVLPFIGVREVYGLKIFIDESYKDQDSKFATSKSAKYILSAIPELVTILIFCFVGIKTRHMSKLAKDNKYTVVEGVGAGYQWPER